VPGGRARHAVKTAALGFVALLAACGGGSPRAPEEPPIPQAPAGTDRAAIERETVIVEQLWQRACECPDVACLAAVDRELSSYYREAATFNDPITDLETWPPDLDARARRALYHLHECMDARGAWESWRGAIVARRVSLLRDAACSCPDLACARRISEQLTEMLASDEDARIDRRTTEEIQLASDGTKRCLAVHLPEMKEEVP